MRHIVTACCLSVAGACALIGCEVGSAGLAVPEAQVASAPGDVPTDALARALSSHAPDGPCTGARYCWISPSPKGDTLVSIAGTGPNDVWFGTRYAGLMHFDGQTVRDVQTGLSPTGELLSFAPNDVWAVGADGIAHWDGVSFQQRHVAAGKFYADVWGARPDDVYVVGRTELVHFDGKSFQVVPGVEGEAIAGSGADDVWVGGDGLWHFDGATWARVDALDGVLVADLIVPSRGDVWLLGNTDGDDDVWHFDGVGWHRQHVMKQVDAEHLTNLGTGGPGDVWLLGEVDGAGLLLHHDGSAWRRRPNAPTATNAMRTIAGVSYVVGDAGRILRLAQPRAQGYENLTPGHDADLTGTWGSAADDLWAVGERGTALHFDGSKVRETATGVKGSLEDVWGTASDDVWAVGEAGSVVHWAGVSWTPVAKVDPGWQLLTVFTAGRGEAWVGGKGMLARVTTAGATRMELALPPRGAIHDIHGVAPDDVWAVGGSERVGYVSHFDGKAWSAPLVLRHANKDCPITRVRALAPNDVWAHTSRSLDWHWDGVRWTAVPAPADPAAPAVGLRAPRFDGFPLGDQLWRVDVDGSWKYQLTR